MGVQSLFLLNLKVVEPSALRWMAGRVGFCGRLLVIGRFGGWRDAEAQDTVRSAASSGAGFLDAGNLLKPLKKIQNSLLRRSNSWIFSSNADSRHLRSTPLLQKQSQPVSWASAVHSDRKEEKKPAEGRRRALWRPVLVVGSFLKRIGIKLVKGSILNRVAYRTPDRQREAFWNRVAYRKLDRQREPFWIS